MNDNSTKHTPQQQLSEQSDQQQKQRPQNGQRALHTKLNPESIELLQRHFWCDFSDIIPSMSWEKPQKPN